MSKIWRPTCAPMVVLYSFMFTHWRPHPSHLIHAPSSFIRHSLSPHSHNYSYHQRYKHHQPPQTTCQPPSTTSSFSPSSPLAATNSPTNPCHSFPSTTATSFTNNHHQPADHPTHHLITVSFTTTRSHPTNPNPRIWGFSPK
ncbi:hypothetical protein RND81_06G083100 [Saponaria officinalis]|uniref:Uncharacterized protein n=1 Tax=Saponaria officinalis TaxID=3572 RepID=A0AAW1K9E4_SAPOF